MPNPIAIIHVTPKNWSDANHANTITNKGSIIFFSSKKNRESPGVRVCARARKREAFFRISRILKERVPIMKISRAISDPFKTHDHGK